MNAEEQKYAIAEWMGAVEISESGIARWPKEALSMLVRLKCAPAKSSEHKGWIISGVPDYPNDLNAMHETESKMTFAQSGAYETILELVVNEDFLMDNSALVWPTWHATAAQRSEALCRTLWPERFLK